MLGGWVGNAAVDGPSLVELLGGWVGSTDSVNNPSEPLVRRVTELEFVTDTVDVNGSLSESVDAGGDKPSLALLRRVELVTLVVGVSAGLLLPVGLVDKSSSVDIALGLVGTSWRLPL
jgi:hypothetical protein